MPEGPLGGPRPGATCTMEIKVDLNNHNHSTDTEVIEGIAESSRIVSRADSMRVFNDTIIEGGEEFDIAVVSIVTKNSNIMLSEVESMVSDLESVVGERVSVEIRCS